MACDDEKIPMTEEQLMAMPGMTDADTEAGRGEGLALAEWLDEAAGELGAEVRDRYHADHPDGVHPAQQSKYDYGMRLVKKVREAARRLRESDPGGDRDREYAEMIDQVLEGLDSLRRDQSLPVRVRLIAGQAWGIIAVDEASAAPTDEAPEGRAGDEAECLVNALVTALEDAHGVRSTRTTPDVREAYDAIYDRLRTPPVREGGAVLEDVDLPRRIGLMGYVAEGQVRRDDGPHPHYFDRQEAEDLKAAAEILRRLRRQPEPTREGCTCPRWAEQHGWDPDCPRHGFDWDTACEGEHLPGDSSYGFTSRGGTKVRCQTCAAPLELHPDDSPPTYTEGWQSEPGEPTREGGGET